MFRTLWHWVDTRLQVGHLLRTEAERELPAGTGWAFVLGSSALFLFFVLVITGALMLFVYVPTPDHATDSLQYLHKLNFGRFIHGLHHWGASAMIVVVLLHFLRVFYYKAFRAPRELTWIVGITLLLLVLAMGFTGFLLPWDREGYWGTVVGVHIAEQTPLIGHQIATLLRGGPLFGSQTLSRFFALHIFVLPVLMVGLIGIHLRLVTKLGTAGPLKSEKHSRRAGFAFFPRQVARDLGVALLVLAAIVLLATLLPMPDKPPADPGDTRFIPRPPWYFLPMFQFLHYVPGKLEPLAAVVIPGLVVAFLLVIPWIDRRQGSTFFRGRPVAWLVSAGVISLLMLGALALPDPNPPSSSLAVGAVPADAGAGKELYQSVGCVYCHGADAAGTKDGPSLHRAVVYHDRPWLVAHFKNPEGVVPGSTMKRFDWLTDQELNELVDYLMQVNREHRPW